MNRENWKTVKLGDIAELQFGYAYKSDKFISNEIPVIRIGDITETGVTPDYSCCYPLSFWNEHPELRLKKNSILIAMSGATVGKSCINDKDEKLLLNQRVASIVSTDKSFTKYLFHSIKSNSFKTYVEKASIGCAQPNISGKQISEFEIPLPPLDVQKQIALNLDQVTKVIAEHKELLAKYDLLIKSRFIEMFRDPVTNPMGWEVKKLGDCIEKIENGTSFICSNNSRTVGKSGLLKLSSVTYGIYNQYENKELISEDDFISDDEVKKGDLLFTRKNTPELVGMSAYVFDTKSKLMLPDLIFRICTSEQLNKIFLWKLLNHPLFRDKVRQLAHGSAKSMSNISKESLKKLEIILPPLELQQQFADFVQQIDKSKLIVQQSLDKAETLYKSLMQEYFG